MTPSSLILPGNPNELGLPKHFTQWRGQQEQAIDRTINLFRDELDIVVANKPTGSGKSLYYISVAVLMGWRAAVLTANKALQDQIAEDFSSIGLVTVKGKAAYSCGWLREQHSGGIHNCEQGAESNCPLRGGRKCPAKAAIEDAKKAKLVSANAAMWMSANEFIEGGLGTFDILIIDECHDFPDLVCNHLRVDWFQTDDRALALILGRDVRIPSTTTPGTWASWATDIGPELGGALTSLKETIRETPGDRALVAKLGPAVRVKRKIDRLCRMPDDWIIQKRKPYKGPSYFAFDPLWPKEYTESMLLCNTPRVLMTSATATHKTPELLGMHTDEYELLVYPPVFPWARGPVYHLWTTSMRHNMSSEGWENMLGALADLMEYHQDRKGLIHSVSYPRRDDILTGMRRMVPDLAYGLATHNKGGTTEALNLFFNSPPGTVFVSPSVATGYDFKYQRAEWQAVTKIPFPDSRDSVVAARSKQDPDYPMHIAIQTLVQMCGRVMRADDDRGETFILDNNVSWLLKLYRHLVPDSFRVRAINDLPRVPPSLASEGIGASVPSLVGVGNGHDVPLPGRIRALYDVSD
jgi:Rad3-related DNA helicase